MFEQDYIMRLIKEMVRMILKIVFHIDTESPTADLLENEEEKNTLEQLLAMIDEGRICEAENQLYDLTANGSMNNLEMGLMFYSYLNDKEDTFLEAHYFSREEIKQGIEELISGYGLSSMRALFLY